MNQKVALSSASTFALWILFWRGTGDAWDPKPVVFIPILVMISVGVSVFRWLSAMGSMQKALLGSLVPVYPITVFTSPQTSAYDFAYVGFGSAAIYGIVEFIDRKIHAAPEKQ
jgi:hypothetical protein